MNEREAFEAFYYLERKAPFADNRDAAWAAWQARAALADAERARVAKRCAEIVGSVDNYANPMTANDCVDAILAEFPEAK